MKVSIITPSLDHAAFIPRTLESVLGQRGGFELEYIVVDGGSTDGTLDILRRYEGRLRFVSGPDGGQSDAINRGFRMASGDVLAWLNSDDTYLPGAIARAVEVLRVPGPRWCFGRCRNVDEQDRVVRGAVAAYKNAWGARFTFNRLLSQNFIAQPAVFFRREMLDAAGPLDPSFHLAMDYDLWLRFARLADPVFVPEDLACFRWHGASKTRGRYREGTAEALRIARHHARGGARHAIALHHAVHLAQVALYAVSDRLRR